jgi:hypothetical protein
MNSRNVFITVKNLSNKNGYFFKALHLQAYIFLTFTVKLWTEQLIHGS